MVKVTGHHHDLCLTCFFYVFINIVTPSRRIWDVIMGNKINLGVEEKS